MPTKIGFTVISCTGEDERYRATDLNYHGPTVKGWRSAQYCSYPQDITIQLHSPAILHRIQILAHQYLIPQKIEIWTCEELELDPSVSPSGSQCFQYLGFITLSDNQTTGFKSRELKSVTTPHTAARFVRLRLFENHNNEKNLYNQVGLVAVSVLGDTVSLQELYGNEVNNNGQFDSITNCDSNLISNPQYTSPYDDLAFEMYVDNDVARIMRLMESKKHQAVIEERFEYARKLKLAMEQLREAGETLGRYEQEKRQAINMEDYDKAKAKKKQIEKYRDDVYSSLQVERLLELDGPLDENDSSKSSDTIKPRRETELEEDSDESALEVETRSPQHTHFLQSPPSPGDHHVTWSPHRPPPHHQERSSRRPQRRTSLSDYPSLRSLAPSPNPLSHSFSHSSFPTSSSINQLRQTPSETIIPQFQCYTPYSYHPTLNICNEPSSLDNMYKSLPPIQLNEPFYLKSQVDNGTEDVPPETAKSPPLSNASRSPTNNNRPIAIRGTIRRRSRSNVPLKNSYEDYEERMLPALRHPQLHTNDNVRECQLPVDQTRKSKLNEREKKQAALPITVFGIELVEKFYSKHFADKEEGLRLLQEELKTHSEKTTVSMTQQFSANKIARASIYLLHRALRDKVYSVYSAAADAIRFFFHEFVPGRVASAEVARSVEKLVPELLAKSGDVTPRIHNMAAHTLLSMLDCKQVRDLHIIPVILSRPLSSSVHPRLALSRLEMVEQLILNHGISTEKQSGLTCRTLAEFGSSGLHHPAEAVRKVSERILVQVYKVNPRIVRKQLPPDDDVTRRNLLYRQLFQEFDLMDIQKRREQATENINNNITKPSNLPLATKELKTTWNSNLAVEKNIDGNAISETSSSNIVSHIPKRTVNQQTSPMKPFIPSGFEENNENKLTIMTASKSDQSKGAAKKAVNGNSQTEVLLRRRNMSRISEETNEISPEKEMKSIYHFPNLVDSVHVTETRLALAQKTASSLKSMRYIFPTTYIGTTSQETVNQPTSHIPLRSNQQVSQRKVNKSSGIPIPKNGFNGKHKLTSIVSNRLIKPTESQTKQLTRMVDSDMTVSVYIPDETAAQHNSADNSSSASVISPPSEGDVAQKGEKEGQSYKTCIFCFAQEDWFTEESLNMHYWKNCPMLTRCSKCKEVVEISGLIQHRLDDCEHRKSFLKCDKCNEAILKEFWDDHDCRSCRPGMARLRCPLCHNDLDSDVDWRSHLMGNNPCQNHPRRVTSSNP